MRHVLSCVVLLVFGLLISGCSQTIDKNSYLMELDKTESAYNFDANKKVLGVDRFYISEKYKGKGFIYKVSESEFKSDYYNEFMIWPEEIIREEVYGWLKSKSVLNVDFIEELKGKADFKLGCRVEKLYVDVSSEPESVVMEIKFVLSKKHDNGYKVVFEKTYLEREEIGSREGSFIVKAYTKSLENIINKFSSEFTKVE